jgi:hypothetical protein
MRTVTASALPTKINFNSNFNNSSYVSVESILSGENCITGLEDYIDSYIEALFGVKFEEFVKFHGGKQFSMFIKVNQKLQEDLNYQFKSWRVLNSDIEVSDKEIHAIISLTFGSRKHEIYQDDSVFYSNRFVKLTLENRVKFLQNQIKNPPPKTPEEGLNQYCGRLKKLLTPLK